MKTKFFAQGISFAAVLLLMGAGCTTANNTNNGLETEQNNSNIANQVIVEEKNEDDDINKVVEEENVNPVKVGNYKSYTKDTLEAAKDGIIVLFFHASWCPSCKTLDKDIVNSVAGIPEGVTILKVDYDVETELKKKYGVTSQHTFVQIDSDGTEIKKWVGGTKLNDVIDKINL